MLNDYTVEGFLNLISLPNRIIYRRKTKNIHRAWILIYERVMLNDALLCNVERCNVGVKFWEDDPFFRFRYPVNNYGINEDLVLRNAVLYGPLSLCNSNERVNGMLNSIVVQFENFHSNGRECRWCLTYYWGNHRSIENRGTADEMEILTNYYRVELNAVEGEDLFHDEVDYTRTQQPRFLESANSAVSFPHRVIMGAQNPLYEDGIEYL